MVFVNGRFQPQLSQMAKVPAGLRLSRLADLLRQEPETLKGRLGAGLSFDDRGFVALNAAFCEDGAVLMVAPEAVIDSPVHLVFLSTAEPEPVVSYPRILVLAERNSSLTLIEHYPGVGDHRNFCNPVVEIETDTGARLTHYKLQQDSPGAFHIGSVHVRQRRDSVYRSHHVSLGSRLARTDINVHLQEPGAEVHLDGLFMGTGRQHLDTHTRVYHEAPHTRSYESYKGILDKHARGVFKGRVLVQRDAQKIEAHQSSANLLLSDQAEVDTKPELEIYADDVVCSHGATVGQLDRQALFYLLSRGIDRKWAEGLLTFAFAEEVVSRMDLAPLRERLESIIVGRLPDSEKLRELV
jgi:Fe-S cluster assembly protein SufD